MVMLGVTVAFLLEQFAIKPEIDFEDGFYFVDFLRENCQLRVFDNSSARFNRIYIAFLALANMGSLAILTLVHAPTHNDPTCLVLDMLWTLQDYIFHSAAYVINHFDIIYLFQM
jgi:hypothetical protein